VFKAWQALVAAGGADPALAERAAAAFDLPSLLGMLLFSTSVGVSLPGASATFLEFSATVKSSLAPDVPYRLESRVAHRSKATTIVKKAVTVAPVGGEPAIEAKLAALVNPPARAMPTVEELRAEALDLGVRGKVVLVTGASRGLGETIAKLFALSGARVVVNYHRGAADADRVVGELTEAGAEALAVRADVSEVEDVRALVRAAVERFGTVDVLVNNAARDYRPVPFSRLTWDEVSKDLEVIVKGALLCCQEVLPLMRVRGSGKIVNVGSLATEVPPPDQAKYVIAKSALVGLTRSLAAELAPHGIQVNMVVPHFVETDFVAHIQKGFRTRIAEEVPMGRLATPAEVAQAVVYLASSWAGFTTGQKLMVTGGSPPLL
jgi:3-oxoacyl-[acyl-carrier protein] reductase